MTLDKKDVVRDIQFCKDLMDRLLKDAKKYGEASSYDDKHTVLQADIIRLRRELNEVRKKLDWDYKE
jgi:hypothetical protein